MTLSKDILAFLLTNYTKNKGTIMTFALTSQKTSMTIMWLGAEQWKDIYLESQTKYWS